MAEIDLSGKILVLEKATICLGPCYQANRIAQVPLIELLGAGCQVTLRIVVEKGKIEDYP